MVGSNWTWAKGLRGVAVAGALAASTLMGSQVKAAEEKVETATPTFTLNPFDLPENFGWLSDPKAPAEGVGDALFGGKFSLNNRLRWEHVAQTGKEETNALTNRTRFGYGTKPLSGVSAYVELENNTPFDRSSYNAAGAQGNAAKAIVADPEEVELNQAYIKYVYKGDFKLDLIVGRQRMIIDDARFIGNVGWRQMEQTYDAVNVTTDLGVKNLELQYAYIWKVNRIFTEESTAANEPFESQSHIIHGSYKFCDAFKLTAFAYLLDLSTDLSSDASSATYGVTGSGKVKLDDTWSFDYKLTYATQSDYADSTKDYTADFFAADGKFTVKDLGFGGVGYQMLGSDDGNIAFAFPLGTNHAYQGWADLFLGTPPQGLQDIYLYVGTTLPWDIKGAFYYHTFNSDEGDFNFGDEYDAVLSKKINKNWSVLTKLAVFKQGDTGMGSKPDTTKFWLETTFTF